MFPSTLFTVLIAGISTVSPALAQRGAATQPFVITDSLSDSGIDASQFPRHLRLAAGRVLFTAGTEWDGAQVWSLDPSNDVLDVVVDPHPRYEVPRILGVVNEVAYFAYEGDEDWTLGGLWRTVEDARGAELVARGAFELVGQGPDQLLLFDAAESVVWVVDAWGAAALGKVPGRARLGSFVQNEFRFFVPRGPYGLTSLWRASSADGRLEHLRDIWLVNSASDEPRWAEVVGDKLIFPAPAFEENALWISDGSVAGTTPFRLGIFSPLDSDGQRFWFRGAREGPPWLLSTDGHDVDEQWPLPEGFGFLALFDGEVFFSSGVPARELWRTDGSESGTVVVVADCEELCLFGYDFVARATGGFYFGARHSSTATNGAADRNLYFYDPESSAVRSVYDSGWHGAEFVPLGETGGGFYFCEGSGLFRADGITAELLSQYQCSKSFVVGNPGVALGDELYVPYEQPLFGRFGLLRLRGSVVEVAAHLPDHRDFGTRPRDRASVGEELVFATFESLYATGGRPSDARALPEAVSFIRKMEPVGEGLLYCCQLGGNDRLRYGRPDGPFVTVMEEGDGFSTSGTIGDRGLFWLQSDFYSFDLQLGEPSLLVESVAYPSGAAQPFYQPWGTTHVVFQDGESYGFFRVTDGTPAGTSALFGIGEEGFSEPRAWSAVGSDVFFIDTARRLGVWSSDSNASLELRDFGILPGSEQPPSMVAADTRVVLSARSELGSEVWVSDGTLLGTALSADIWKGARGSSPRELVALGGDVYFTADSPRWGRELWILPEGSTTPELVVDLWPGAEGSQPTDLKVIKGLLYFVANDGLHGFELWVLSRGKAVRLTDIIPGRRSSVFGNLERAGDSVTFDGLGDDDGIEIWGVRRFDILFGDSFESGTLGAWSMVVD